MTPTDLMRRYMIAAIRTQHGHRCAGWSSDEILESYAMCLEPTVPISEWAQAIGADVTLGNDEISTAHTRAHNTIALRQLPPYAEVS